jgi:hypothetical protein
MVTAEIHIAVRGVLHAVHEAGKKPAKVRPSRAAETNMRQQRLN